MTNSTFIGNQANGCGLFPCGSSGAIVNNRGSMLTVTNSTFTDNSSFSAGGAISNDGTLTVTKCSFSNNHSTGGGAIYNIGALDVTASTFADGRATAICSQVFCIGGLGGAIQNAGMLAVTNSTFAGNSAVGTCSDTVCGGGRGGAIYNAGALFGISITLSANSATDGGAAVDTATTCGDGGTAPCLATLANTIVANSSAGNSCTGLITDRGHNLDDGTSCGFGAANGSLSNTVPQLDPAGLANNGGPTQTIALLPGSPAIDAGDDTVCAAAPVNHFDQRGLVRPGAGHAHCSIGAYEYYPAATPTSQSTPTALSATATPTSLSTPTTCTSGCATCVGDCDGSGTVAVNNVITLVYIDLGNADASSCPRGIPSGAMVTISLIVQAVNNALNGCPL